MLDDCCLDICRCCERAVRIDSSLELMNLLRRYPSELCNSLVPRTTAVVRENRSGRCSKAIGSAHIVREDVAQRSIRE